jgi:hypothetical protein
MNMVDYKIMACPTCGHPPLTYPGHMLECGICRDGDDNPLCSGTDPFEWNRSVWKLLIEERMAAGLKHELSQLRDGYYWDPQEQLEAALDRAGEPVVGVEAAIAAAYRMRMRRRKPLESSPLLRQLLNSPLELN